MVNLRRENRTESMMIFGINILTSKDLRGDDLLFLYPDGRGIFIRNGIPVLEFSPMEIIVQSDKVILSQKYRLLSTHR